MNKTVLLTGGLGYVGGRIAQALKSLPGVDLRIATSRKNVKLSEALSGINLVHLDLQSDQSSDVACNGVDCIVHLAALNEIDSAKDPARALLVNGLGSLKLLESAEKSGVNRFIYMSTAHVYGAPLVNTITELTLPRPVHPYAITHRIAEDFVLASHDRKALTGIVVRLSNGYGAPIDHSVNRWTLIFNDLCRQAVTTGRLELKSSGLQRRDFIALEDVARAVVHLIELSANECGDGLFNLGGEQPLQILEVAELIASRCEKVLGFTPPIIRPAEKPGENPAELDYQIHKLKQTGFNLTGNMNSEIDATLLMCSEWFGGR